MVAAFHQFPYLSDNYGVLIREESTGRTACIDAGEPNAVFNALEKTGWSLDELWITHWHHDHTDGVEAVRAGTGCKVVGPAFRGGRDIRYDRQVGAGDTFAFGALTIRALHTPGHTKDMINYLIEEPATLFAGDTLFAMGCGRVFEGTHQEMYESMKALRALAPETVLYAGHEYTQANARFALSVDPSNEALIGRAEEVAALRADGKPTLPSTLAREFETNPFLRYDDPAIRAHLGMETSTDAEVFSELRSRKDNL